MCACEPGFTCLAHRRLPDYRCDDYPKLPDERADDEQARYEQGGSSDAGSDA